MTIMGAIRATMLHLTEVSENLFNSTKMLANKDFSSVVARVYMNYMREITT